MTDKQIIIDGVQFNKWGDFLIDYELNGIYKTISSSDKCYKILKSLIEQLKRKEQECEELKTKLLNLLGKEGLRQSEKEFYEQQLDQLKAENSKLKYKAEFFENYNTAHINKIMKLEKILTEIKEVANYSFNLSTSELMVKLEQILQKISECEVENDKF